MINKYQDKDNSNILTVVIFPCLFGCPIITYKPLDRIDSNFDWGT